MRAESEMEGRYLLRVHAYRERSPGLRRRKIKVCEGAVNRSPLRGMRV